MKLEKREILFRGKRLDDQCIDGSIWVEGYYIKDMAGNSLIVTITENEINDTPDVLINPETVTQYTGLKDCKDKKIFEGDIIKFAKKDGFVLDLSLYICLEIFWNNGQWAVCDSQNFVQSLSRLRYYNTMQIVPVYRFLKSAQGLSFS